MFVVSVPGVYRILGLMTVADLCMMICISPCNQYNRPIQDDLY